MIQPVQPPDGAGKSILTVEEQAMLEKLQALYAQGYEEVPPDVIAELEQTLRWDESDPASLERAAYFMAHDPYMLREIRAINDDFAALERGEGRLTNGGPTG